MKPTTRRALAACLAALAAGAAAAQPGDPMQPAPEAPATPEQAPAPAPDPFREPVLSGPRIPRNVATTLVRFNARGEFQRCEGRPEEAALSLINLDPAARERAREVCTERGVALGLRLVDDIDLVKEIADLVQAGKRDQAAEVARRIYDRFEPRHERDPLRARLHAVLSPEESGELDRLVDEYWGAWMDWELRRSREKTDRERTAAEQRMTFQLFQDELRLAYDRTLRPYRERLDALFAQLDPTPEQRSAMRDIVIDFIKQSRLRPTTEQRHEAVMRMYRALDEGRRTRLFEMMVTADREGR